MINQMMFPTTSPGILQEIANIKARLDRIEAQINGQFNQSQFGQLTGGSPNLCTGIGSTTQGGIQAGQSLGDGQAYWAKGPLGT